MPNSLKALIVVSTLAFFVFRFAKPIVLLFTDERDYSRRRNIWFALTVTAFLSPNFWFFVLVAVPLMLWGGRKDKNPVALYLLIMHVIPPIPIDIPLPGFNSLFSLDNYRLLSFFVLIPAVWRLRQSKDASKLRGITFMDVLLLAYGALQVLLFVAPDLPNHVVMQDSFTNEIRSAFLFFVDFYVLYYAVSRLCSTSEAIRDAQAAFCVACLIMATLAVFETLRHWLLYTDIAVLWSGEPAFGFYRAREGLLRAQVSSGNTLALGFLLAIACGFWLYLQRYVAARFWRIAITLLLWLGLLATYSRGPWIGAVVIYIVVAALATIRFSKLFKGAAAALLIVIVVMQTPLGDRISSMLPFLSKSSADTEASFSIKYRERLLVRSWQLIEEHPFFGDQLALQKLDDMRQGEGIIDMVNTYVEVAVFYGFIGLGLFIGLILIALVKAYRAAKRMSRNDSGLARMGLVLSACIVGTLFMLATCSFISGYAQVFYVLAGFAAAYAKLRESPKSRSNANVLVAQSPGNS
jgi:O-antigen ligase